MKKINFEIFFLTIGCNDGIYICLNYDLNNKSIVWATKKCHNYILVNFILYKKETQYRQHIKQ